MPAATDESLLVDGLEVMMRWEEPYMAALAQIAVNPASPKKQKEVLEAGFGMGISAGFVQELKPAYHGIMEA